MFEEQVKKNKGFTFPSKPPADPELGVPGPGAYEQKVPTSIRPTSALYLSHYSVNLKLKDLIIKRIKPLDLEHTMKETTTPKVAKHRPAGPMENRSDKKQQHQNRPDQDSTMSPRTCQSIPTNDTEHPIIFDKYHAYIHT